MTIRIRSLGLHINDVIKNMFNIRFQLEDKKRVYDASVNSNYIKNANFATYYSFGDVGHYGGFFKLKLHRDSKTIDDQNAKQLACLNEWLVQPLSKLTKDYCSPGTFEMNGQDPITVWIMTETSKRTFLEQNLTFGPMDNIKDEKICACVGIVISSWDIIESTIHGGIRIHEQNTLHIGAGDKIEKFTLNQDKNCKYWIKTFQKPDDFYTLSICGFRVLNPE